MNGNERFREDGGAPALSREGDSHLGGRGDHELNRRALFANLRHELRTPLSAMLGYVEMLLEDVEDLGLADIVPDVERIRAEGKELLNLVNELLDPERLEGEELERDGEHFLFELCYRLRTPLNGVLGYAELLLETNAVTDCQDIGSHLMKIHGAATEFLLFVEQADGCHAKRPNTGEAVDKLSAGHALAEDALRSMRPSTGGMMHRPLEEAVVLVVDDYEMNREVVSSYLERCGSKVLAAADGEQALEVMDSQRVDLVLLDVMLPGLNGYSLLKQMKREKALRDIPVIMISALDEKESVLRCIEIGAEDYVIKPFDPALLRARLEACLDKRRTRDSELGEISRELDAKSHALADAAEKLESGCRRIEALEEEAQRMDALIQREARKGRQVSVRDILPIWGFGLILSLLFNAANPSGVPLVPECWSHPVPLTMSAEVARFKLEAREAVFVDARPAAYHQRGHIPGSLNIPLPLFEFVYVMKLAGLESEKEIIVYGRDFSRLHDRDVAVKLQSRGHTNVYVLEDFTSWKERGYPIEQ